MKEGFRLNAAIYFNVERQPLSPLSTIIFRGHSVGCKFDPLSDL